MGKLLRRSLPLCILTTHCGGPDSTLHKLTEPNPPPHVAASLRVDLAIQEREWGETVTRCQVQVAFEPLPEFTDPSAAAEGALDGADDEVEEPAKVVIPDIPGTCAFSEVDPPDAPSEPQEPSDRDPDAPGEPEADSDNWQLSGEVVGPDFIELWDGRDAWTLDAVETPHGGLRYEWVDCARDGYPYGATLSMDVPESSDPDGVYAFTMTDLIPVGPRVVLDAPESDGGRLPVFDPAQPLYVAWHTEGIDPELGGTPVASEVLVKLKSQDQRQEEPVRWLVCRAEGDDLELSVEALAPLVEGRDDPEVYTTNLDVHTQILVRERPTPWGEAMTVRTHGSAGAGLKLTTEPVGEHRE